MTDLRPPIGFPLLPVPDAEGRLSFPTLAQSVRQSIEAILRTRPGERLMRPEFGGGLLSFIGESNTTATRRRIGEAITAALTRWEDRITLDRVDVDEVSGAPSAVRVEIVYRLRRTGAPQQLALSMDLGG